MQHTTHNHIHTEGRGNCQKVGNMVRETATSSGKRRRHRQGKKLREAATSSWRRRHGNGDVTVTSPFSCWLNLDLS